MCIKRQQQKNMKTTCFIYKSSQDIPRHENKKALVLLWVVFENALPRLLVKNDFVDFQSRWALFRNRPKAAIQLPIKYSVMLEHQLLPQTHIQAYNHVLALSKICCIYSLKGDSRGSILRRGTYLIIVIFFTLTQFLELKFYT